jgi:hypothetical protein
LAVGVAAASVGLAAPAAALTNPQLTITGSPSTTVGLQVFANANLMGATNPTGTLTFRLYAPGDTGCTSPVFTSTVPVTGTSVNSERYTTTAAGTWRWTSAYSGDANYSPTGPTSCTDPAGAVIVDPARAVLSVAAPPLVGGALHGTATLTGGFRPTGSLTFNLHLQLPDDPFCAGSPVFTSTVPVSGPGSYDSAPFVPLLGGTYRWRASYTGDADNRPISLTGCLDAAASVVVSLTQPPTPSGGRYTPVAPARILDTRDGTGGISGPLGSGSTADVQVSGRGGMPSSGVTAVAMNVTVTEPTATGYLTLFPAGSSRPLAANLNFVPGDVAANLVVVMLGSGGKVSLFNSLGTSHVVFDVAGWYSDAGTAADGRYQPVAPARILDTRDGSGGLVRLGPGVGLDLQVAGRGGVPSTGAEAVVMNVAATNGTAMSYLTVYPTGDPRPSTSNLNFLAGETASNRALVRLGSGGRVSVFNAAGSADVVVDVSGWITDGTATGTAGRYNALAPARILDTRSSGAVVGGATTDVQVTGQGGVPASGVTAVVLNATVTQPAAGGFLTVFAAGSARPMVSDLNYAAGETRPNLVVVQLGAGGRVSLFSSATSHVVFDVAGWLS